MKLCQFGSIGEEDPGIVLSKTEIVDVSGLRGPWTGADLSPDGLKAARALPIDDCPRAPDGVRLGVPWQGISKYICIGLNYADHAAEAGMEPPSEPIVFLKAPSAICGPTDPIPVPRGSTKLDWEVELGVVIGTTARNVPPEAAMSHIAGYCTLNDVSERAFQMATTQWDKGKGCDGFGPIGPWLATADEVPDPQALRLGLDVNGASAQDGTTAQMIFDVKALVAHLSGVMTLLPGDAIATGTPPGVGMGLKPEPRFLSRGDEVSAWIEGLGRQRQKVV